MPGPGKRKRGRRGARGKGGAKPAAPPAPRTSGGPQPQQPPKPAAARPAQPRPRGEKEPLGERGRRPVPQAPPPRPKRPSRLVPPRQAGDAAPAPQAGPPGAHLRPEDLADGPQALSAELLAQAAGGDFVSGEDEGAEGEEVVHWDDPPPPAPPQPHRAGFVAIVGRPNVGKSTLLNRLLGQKLAIVSPKPQTTRSRILGILSRPEFQIALLDTPGLHEARGGLNARMVEAALQTLADADAALFLIEAGSPAIDAATRKALDQVLAAKKPTLLVINKIDAVEKTALLPLIDRWRHEHAWTEVYPLSALTGENVERFAAALARHLPEGPALFGADVWTDVSERDLCAELVREQILRRTAQEVPYSCAVLVEQFDESERNVGRQGLVRVLATILVERDSQKGILIGKGGAMLREIGAAARREMERLLGCRVFLETHVRIEPGWTQSEAGLARAGYTPRKS